MKIQTANDYHLKLIVRSFACLNFSSKAMIIMLISIGRKLCASYGYVVMYDLCCQF